MLQQKQSRNRHGEGVTTDTMKKSAGERIKGILLGTIIGDALGTPLAGMSRGHIKNIFKTVSTYTDPLPALKGKTDRWRKPGLYSSLSQMIILIAMLKGIHQRGIPDRLIRFAPTLPEVAESDYGIFRHPGDIEKNFITRTRRSGVTEDAEIPAFPSARLTPLLSPSLLREETTMQTVTTMIPLALLFTQNYFALAGALSFGILLRRLIREDPVSANLLHIARDETARLGKQIHENAHLLFDLGCNPVTLEEAITEFVEIYHSLANTADETLAEEMIYTNVNRFLKTPITRATVNNALSLVPYALFIAESQRANPSAALFTVVGSGGETSTLCALTGSIMGALFGTAFLPPRLTHELVNKKRMSAIVEALTEQKCTEAMIREFVDAEMALTAKELEERRAKMKHARPTKRKKPVRDRERELSRHVVESWTKTDKARWKKERERFDKSTEK